MPKAGSSMCCYPWPINISRSRTWTGCPQRTRQLPRPSPTAGWPPSSPCWPRSAAIATSPATAATRWAYPNSAYLADLARSGRWLRLAGHTQGWARLQHVSPWTLAARTLRGKPTTSTPGWLTPLTVELAAEDRRAGVGSDVHARTLQEIQMVGRTARADAELAETFGLSLHNPTRTRRSSPLPCPCRLATRGSVALQAIAHRGHG
jgi:hypothetical protein